MRVLAIALATLVWLVPSSRVLAQDGRCDDTVVSDPGVLGDGGSAVEAEARRLAEAGADVRVRALASGASDLDRWFEDALRSCASWRSPSGGPRPNLVVVAVSVGDRRTGIYTGESWEPRLGRHWIDIQRDEMNPRFRNGDIGGGLAAGMRAVHGLITGTDTQPQPAPEGARRSAIPLIVVAGAAVLLVGGGLAGRSALASRRRLREALTRTTAARDEAAAAFVALDEQWTSARGAASSVRGSIGAGDAAELDRLLADAETAVAAGTQAHVEAADAYDASAPRTVADADGPTARFGEGKARLESARAAADAALRFAEILARLASELPAAVAALRAGVDAGRATAGRVRDNGYRVDDALAKLTRAEELAAEAEARTAARELTAAKEALDAGTDLVDRTASWVDGLPALRARLEAEVDALDARLRELPATIASARALFETLSRDVAQPAWEPVAGNGTESEKRRDAAAGALAAAREAVSMQRQDWQAAHDALARTDAWLDEADTLLGAIHGLRKAVDEAARDLPAEIDAARADVDAADSFVRAHDADVSDELTAAAREARDVLAEAERLGDARPPDVLGAVRLARDANECADRVLAQARSEQEAVERLRVRAASALREAGSALARADGYVASHRRDSGGHARRLVADAGRAFDEARRASLDDLPPEPGPRTAALESLLAAAEDARRLADDAYEHARRAFRRAEDERRRSTAVVVGAASFGAWGSSSSGGSSGGGSSSWGGGSRGAGGSTGW